MAYPITQLKSDLSGILHGTTTSQITDLDGLINRSARQLLLDCDPMETIRTTPITNAVFNSVYDYSCPTDLKGVAILDIKPQVNRAPTDIVVQHYNQRFDIEKNYSLMDSCTIMYNTAVKTLQITAPTLTTAPVIINQVNSITSNGTWAVGSSASNLAVDNVNFVASSASLSFDLAASGSTGYLENSTMSQLDLSDDVNQGTFFLYTFLPTASDFTNVILRFGSDSSNYYSVTKTVNQQNNAFNNGWNLLAFPWLGATQVGTPVTTAIDYIRVTWTYNGTAQTAVRLDTISEALGTILNIEYYSKYLFRSSTTGAFQETVLNDADLINLDTDSYNLLTYKVAELAVQQQQGMDALQYDGNYFTRLYKENLMRYQALNKSQRQKPQSIYYKQPRPNQNPNPKIRFGF